MFRTIRAIIDENHSIRLLEKIELPVGKRALVTLLEEGNSIDGIEPYLLSEAALATDWNRVEEDKAWSSLQ
jgi:hypothetical protein